MKSHEKVYLNSKDIKKFLFLNLLCIFKNNKIHIIYYITHLIVSSVYKVINICIEI